MIPEVSNTTYAQYRLHTSSDLHRFGQYLPGPQLHYNLCQDVAGERLERKEEERRKQHKEAEENRNYVLVFGEEVSEDEEKTVCQDGEDEDRLNGNDGGMKIRHLESHQGGQVTDGSKGKPNLNLSRKNNNASQKMNYCKMWIANNLLLSTSLSVLSVSHIQKEYQEDCQKEGQEPLNSSVLQDLIHQQFSLTSKSGIQNNYYTNLQLKSNTSNQQEVSAGGASSDSDDQDDEDVLPSEGKPELLNQMLSVTLSDCQRDIIQQHKVEPEAPVSSESVKSLIFQRNPGFGNPQEALVNEANQSLPRDEDRDQDKCVDAADRLLEVVNTLRSQGNINILLKIFGHSSSCSSPSCSSLCRMFRRVRRHVVTARHACKVMQIYSLILRFHVKTCRSDSCGINVCPALRASQQLKRGRDEELHQNDINVDNKPDDLQHTSKRFNRKGYLPLNLSVRLPSPGSLPSDSDGSISSPELSPTTVKFPQKLDGINFAPKI